MGEYLHKDFHGALSCSFQYVKDKYGVGALEEYWRRIARHCYRPLLTQMESGGLQTFAEHWDKIFKLEGGHFRLYFQGEKFVLEVERCPAIAHLQGRRYPIAQDFCRHCAIINEEICRQGGFASSCEPRQEEGKCYQEFWPQNYSC